MKGDKKPIAFVEDTAVERGSRVESILQEIREEAPAAGSADDRESEEGT